jgi:hypothetical protein
MATAKCSLLAAWLSYGKEIAESCVTTPVWVNHEALQEGLPMNVLRLDKRILLLA